MQEVVGSIPFASTQSDQGFCTGGFDGAAVPEVFGANLVASALFMAHRRAQIASELTVVETSTT